MDLKFLNIRSGINKLHKQKHPRYLVFTFLASKLCKIKEKKRSTTCAKHTCHTTEAGYIMLASNVSF